MAGITVAVNDKALASLINSMAGWGAIGNRPDTGDVIAGSFYYDTTNSILYQEQNGAWVAILQVQTLNPANEVVAAGYYAATTLSAVDTDLAAANIIVGKTIFGFAGTSNPAGADTFSRYYSLSLANGVSYTPTDAGLYFKSATGNFGVIEYYSTANTAWYAPRAGLVTRLPSQNGISDATNMRVKNIGGAALEIILMRWYHSIATYERYADQDIAAAGQYTPAVGGVFTWGSETTDVKAYLNLITAGWSDARDALDQGVSIPAIIGDGTNLRWNNVDGGNARIAVVMRLTI